MNYDWYAFLIVLDGDEYIRPLNRGGKLIQLLDINPCTSIFHLIYANPLIHTNSSIKNHTNYYNLYEGCLSGIYLLFFDSSIINRHYPSYHTMADEFKCGANCGQDDACIYTMVQCDECETWYHYRYPIDCTNGTFTEAHDYDIDLPWYCQKLLQTTRNERLTPRTKFNRSHFCR